MNRPEERRVTRIAIAITLDDGSAFTYRADNPLDPKFEMRTPLPPGPMDLAFAPVIEPPRPISVKIDFTANLRSGIVFETSAATPERVLDAYRTVTGIPYDEILQRAASVTGVLSATTPA